MSFTKNVDIEKEGIFSPECYAVAESAVEEAQFYASAPSIWGVPGTPLDEFEQYDIIVAEYDNCDDTYNDAFQFPPFLD